MIKNKAEIFKNLLAKDEATLLPVVHDCLTAKIAERTGFEAVSAGGFAISGVNYGLPDVGLIGLAEMVNVLKNIVSSTSLPVFADADGGYGNDRNTAHTVQQYELAGVASMFLEDQKHPKRCGHMSGKDLISKDEMISKIKTAVKVRENPNFTICARTDAIAVESFDAAIDRARAYVAAGADIIFIEAPENMPQLREIPKAINTVPLLVNMLEGGKTPITPKKDLEKMGYKLIAYPLSTLLASVMASQKVLNHLKEYGDTLDLISSKRNLATFSEYKDIVELGKYI